MDDEAALVLTIENLRGTAQETLRIERGEVTEVKRGHGGGKSTIACALAACLARESDPMGLVKGRANPYQRRGYPAPKARATLAAQDGAFALRWTPHTRTIEEEGAAPAPTPKLGVWEERALDEGTGAERARRWNEAVGLAAIGLDDIEAALVEGSCLGAEALGDIVERLSGAGDAERDAVYDAEQENALANARRHEAAFCAISAEAGNALGRYGREKARKWRPKGWSEALETASDAALAEEAEARAATLAHERESLERYLAMRGRCASARKALAASGARLEALRAEERTARAALARARSGEERAARDAAERAHAQAEEARRRARERLEEAQERARAARAALEQAKDAARAHDTQAEEAQSAREGLARARGAGATCPTCGQEWAQARAKRAEAIAAWEEKAARASPPSPQARESARTALEGARERNGEAEREVEAARDASEAASAAEAQARERARAARGAVEETDLRASEHALGVALGKIEAESAHHAGIEAETEAPDPALVEACAGAVRQAEAALEETAAKRRARALDARARAEHEKATEWGRIAAELGPESGLRARAQARALAGLQGWVGRVRALAGVGEVRIAGGEVLWNGLPIGLASATERWVARTVVRIAVCTRSRAPVCVVDGADRMVEPWKGRMRAACGQIAARTGIAIVWTEAVPEAQGSVVAD